MAAELTQKQRLAVENAAAFATSKLDGIASELDHTGAYPKQLIAALAEDGMLGMVLPEKWDGGDLGFAAYVEVAQSLSRACTAIVSIMNHHVLAASLIAQWGDEAQKSAHLADLATGRVLATSALGETGPAVGIGPDALIATRSGDELILTGNKAFVRNAGVADLYVVFATLAEHVTTNGLFACLVEAGAKGMTVGPLLETMGLNGCPVAHVTFDGTPIGQDAVLHDLSAGPAIAERLLYLGAVVEGAQTVGIALAAATHAAGYAAHRVQFHHPVAHQQAVQTMLADMATDAHFAWLGVQSAAALIDDGSPFEVEAAMVRAFLARFGMRMLMDGCQVEGGLGISESAPKGVRVSLPLARMFRDIAGTTLLDSPGEFPNQLIAASLA